MARWQTLRISKKPLSLVALLSGLISVTAWADVRVGAALGYGGAGIQQTVDVGGVNEAVSRAEGPGMLNLFVDFPVSDKWSVALESELGFRLGPFSSGAQFTGVAARYYFWGSEPGSIRGDSSASIFVRRYTPFIGMQTGVAVASIHRAEDQVPSVYGSGVYFGIKMGFDYPLNFRWGIRPEITYAYTFYSQATPPTVLSEFAAQCGVYYYF